MADTLHLRVLVGLLGITALAACQDEAAPKPTPASSASAASTAAAPPPGSAAPPKPSAEPPAAAADVFDWSKIEAPAMKATYKPGEKVWAVTPLPGSETAIQILPAVVVESMDNDVSVRIGTRKTTVPTTMTRPRVAVGEIEKGTPVLAGNFYAANYARVVAAAANVTVDVSLPGRVTRRDVVRDAVLPLDGKLGFAAPVYFKDAEAERVGVLVYEGKEKSYVADVTRFMKQVPTADLRPIPIGRSLKKGEKVRALAGTSLVEGTVDEVMGEGVLYRLSGPNAAAFSKGGVSFVQLVPASP